MECFPERFYDEVNGGKDPWNAIEDDEMENAIDDKGKGKNVQQKERGSVLLRALDVINGERQQQYGNPEDSFEAIAALWGWWLCDKMRDEITAQDVAMMMCLMKIGREKNGAGKTDNIVDACGYLGLYEDMRGRTK